MPGAYDAHRAVPEHPVALTEPMMWMISAMIIFSMLHAPSLARPLELITGSLAPLLLNATATLSYQAVIIPMAQLLQYCKNWLYSQVSFNYFVRG